MGGSILSTVYLKGVVRRPVSTGWTVLCDWCDARAECEDAIPDGWVSVGLWSDYSRRYCCPQCRKTELPDE